MNLRPADTGAYKQRFVLYHVRFTFRQIQHFGLPSGTMMVRVGGTGLTRRRRRRIAMIFRTGRFLCRL
jgi:hypothetical protein